MGNNSLPTNYTIVQYSINYIYIYIYIYIIETNNKINYEYTYIYELYAKVWISGKRITIRCETLESKVAVYWITMDENVNIIFNKRLKEKIIYIYMEVIRSI